MGTNAIVVTRINCTKISNAQSERKVKRAAAEDEERNVSANTRKHDTNTTVSKTGRLIEIENSTRKENGSVLEKKMDLYLNLIYDYLYNIHNRHLVIQERFRKLIYSINAIIKCGA